jgi:large subunit ribosomal protein L19
MDAIRAIEAEQLQQGRDEVSVGDTVRVHYRIVEGKTERIQVFEGLVICMQREGSRMTFKVRKISYGVGVERTFPLHSPRIQKIEVTRKGRVRRAKLYYIRGRVGKSAKVAELLKRKRSVAVPVDAPEAAGSAAEARGAEAAPAADSAADSSKA